MTTVAPYGLEILESLPSEYDTDAVRSRHKQKGWWLVLLFAAAGCLVGWAAASAEPARCIDAVRQAENSARAGIQGGSGEAVNAREEGPSLHGDNRRGSPRRAAMLAPIPLGASVEPAVDEAHQ